MVPLGADAVDGLAQALHFAQLPQAGISIPRWPFVGLVWFPSLF